MQANFSIHCNSFPVLFYNFCCIIFILVFTLFTNFSNPHALTLGRGTFIEASPQQQTQVDHRQSENPASKDFET